MFFFTPEFLFSPYQSIPILAISHRRTRRVCIVEVIPRNLTFENITYREIVCYNSWCCKDGCCAWYINLAGVIFIILLFILFWKLIENCWRKYCRDLSVAASSQENMLMTSADQSQCASRDHLQDYGSGTRNDGLPTYEQATAIYRK